MNILQVLLALQTLTATYMGLLLLNMHTLFQALFFQLGLNSAKVNLLSLQVLGDRFYRPMFQVTKEDGISCNSNQTTFADLELIFGHS
jgi:hypothetical protein